jgi:hypothetical protein
MSDQVLKHLQEVVLRLDLDDAYKLWEALNKAKKIDKKDLHQLAIKILKRNLLSAHHGLLSWVIQKTNDRTTKEVIELVSEIAKYPLEDRTKSLLAKWLKKEAIKNNETAKEIYWKLESDDNVSVQEIESLKPNKEQCLGILTRYLGKSKKEKLSASMLETVYHLCLNDEEFLRKAIEICDKDQLDNFLSARAVFQAHSYPNLIDIFQEGIDRIADPERKIYLNTILLSAKLIKNPSKELAIEFIKQINNLWSDLNLEKWKEELDDWKEIQKLLGKPKNSHQSQLVKNPLYDIFFMFINNNFTKTPKSIYFEPDVIQEFIKMLSNCGNNLSFLQISLLKMLIQSLRRDRMELNLTVIDEKNGSGFEDSSERGMSHPPEEESSIDKSIFLSRTVKFNSIQSRSNFYEDAAHALYKFILFDVVIFKGHYFVGKDNPCAILLKENDAKFINELLIQMTHLTAEHYPTMNPPRNLCIKHLSMFALQHSRFDLLIQDSYAAFLCMSPSIDGFHTMPNDNIDIAINNAIQFLASTTHSENHKLIQMILSEAIPKYLVNKPESLRKSNLAYVQCILGSIPSEGLSYLFHHLFNHVTNIDSLTDCFAEHNEQLLQLELIQTIVEEIVRKKPIYLSKLIDYLNANVINKLSKTYRKFPEAFEKLLSLLINACNEESMLGLSKSREKLLILLQCHPYVSLDFIVNSEIDQEFKHSAGNCVKINQELQSLKDDKKSLLYHRNTFLQKDCDYSVQELCSRHLWCHVSTEVFTESGFYTNEVGEQWLNAVRNEFILCLVIASEHPSYGALIINLLSTFEKVMQVIRIISEHDTKHANYANDWLQNFLTKLGTQLKHKKSQWYVTLLLEKIGKNMCKNLLPSLVFYEEFFDTFDPTRQERSCIHGYYALIGNGCHDQVEIVGKAIRHCKDLVNTIRFMPDESDEIYDHRSIFAEKSSTFPDEMEFLYLVGFEGLLHKYEENIKKEAEGKLSKGRSHELFINSIKEFRSHTDPQLVHCQDKNKLLPKTLFVKIKNDLNLLKDTNVFNAIMELLADMMTVLPTIPSGDNSVLPEIQTRFLMFAIFHGPYKPGESNKFLSNLYNKYRYEISTFDVSQWDYTEFVRLSLKWILLENPLEPSKFGSTMQKRLMANGGHFRKLFISATEEIKADLRWFKELRPEYTKWYDLWLKKIKDAYKSVNLLK